MERKERRIFFPSVYVTCLDRERVTLIQRLTEKIQQQKNPPSVRPAKGKTNQSWLHRPTGAVTERVESRRVFVPCWGPFSYRYESLNCQIIQLSGKTNIKTTPCPWCNFRRGKYTFNIPNWMMSWLERIITRLRRMASRSCSLFIYFFGSSTLLFWQLVFIVDIKCPSAVLKKLQETTPERMKFAIRYQSSVK